jgi:hypothetical protein
MSDLVFPVLVVVIAIVAAIGSYLVIRRTKRTGRRSLWSYVLLWPLLFERGEQEGGRLFTKRELIGWGLLLLLIVVAVSFNL